MKKRKSQRSEPGYFRILNPFKRGWEALMDWFQGKAQSGRVRPHQFNPGIERLEQRLLMTNNQPPIAVVDEYNILHDHPLIVGGPGVLANDSDPDNGPLSLSAELIPGSEPPPASGTFDFHDNGAFEFTPAAGFFGDVTFQYRAFDGLDYSTPATLVTIHVLNEAPTVEDPGTLWSVEGDTLSGRHCGRCRRRFADDSGVELAPRPRLRPGHANDQRHRHQLRGGRSCDQVPSDHLRQRWR